MHRADSVVRGRRCSVALLAAAAVSLLGPLSAVADHVSRITPVLTPLSSAAATPEAAPCSPLFGCAGGGTVPAVVYDPPTEVSSSAATLHGSIDPDGVATSYDFEYGPTAEPGQQLSTASVALAAGGLPQSVTATITGLSPETRYSVELVATNKRGSRSASGEFDTSAPPRPALGVGDVQADPTVMVEGATVTVSARLSGRLGFYRTYFGAPIAQLQSNPELPALSQPSISDVAVPSSGMARFLPVSPIRNTRFRVQVGTKVSPWLQIYVNPLTELYSTPAPHRQGSVALAYTAAGALPADYQGGPVAYFYRGPSSAGPFRRVARAVFHRSGVSVYARVTIRSHGRSFYVACTRGPIIPGMGRPFYDPRCGRPTLR
jgi:hypothetical protein